MQAELKKMCGICHRSHHHYFRSDLSGVAILLFLLCEIRGKVAAILLFPHKSVTGSTHTVTRHHRSSATSLHACIASATIIRMVQTL